MRVTSMINAEDLLYEFTRLDRCLQFAYLGDASDKSGVESYNERVECGDEALVFIERDFSLSQSRHKCPGIRLLRVMACERINLLTSLKLHGHGTSS